MDIGNIDTNKLRSLLVVPLSLIIVWIIASQAPSQYEKVQERLPSFNVDWDPGRSPYNDSKLALLIEDRPLAHLAPLLLHMISVVPPEWRFLFVGSSDSLNRTNTSETLQLLQASGKLRLTEAPDVGSIHSRGKIDRILTNLTFYEQYVDPAEWLLLFHPDSILCSRSEVTINDWLGYDWVGAPWSINDVIPGSGGLSLRRVSTVKQVLHFQDRLDDEDPEDRWFVGRIGTMPGAKIPEAGVETGFCVQDVFHENPMGYHISYGGTNPHPAVWEDPEQRKKIFDWCPEVKMILDMKFERERCTEEGTNVIDGEEKAKQDEEQKKAEEEAARQAEERKNLEEVIKAAVKAELKQEGGDKDSESSDEAYSEEAESSGKAAAGSTSTAEEAAMTTEGPAEEAIQASEEFIGMGPFTHKA